MTAELLKYVIYLEPAGIATALFFIIRAREQRSYIGLTALLSVKLWDTLSGLALLQIWSRHILPEAIAYPLYFFNYWACFAAESCLAFYMVLNIFRVAMAPLQGLRSLGMLVFRWAAAISLVLATLLSISSFRNTISSMIHFVLQFEQISSIITLSLLFFVCFAVKPLGLSLKSRVFGVALGLGLMATGTLAQAAWFTPQRAGTLLNLTNLIADIGTVCSLAVWSLYFALPEPKRAIIVLPTTSPFLRWNQISEVLGDNPGFVAIAGIPPELFAPAEIDIMLRASRKMKALEFDPEADSITFKTLSA